MAPHILKSVWRRVFDVTGLSPYPCLTNILCSLDRRPSGSQSHAKRGSGEKSFTTPSQSNNEYTNIKEWCDLNATEY